MFLDVDADSGKKTNVIYKVSERKVPKVLLFLMFLDVDTESGQKTIAIYMVPEGKVQKVL